MLSDPVLAIVAICATIAVTLGIALAFMRHEALLRAERAARRRLIYAKVLDDPDTGENAKGVAQEEVGVIPRPKKTLARPERLHGRRRYSTASLEMKS